MPEVGGRGSEPLSARQSVMEAVSSAMRLIGLEYCGKGIQIERPNDPSHGDLSSNIALVMARETGRNPRELADEIVSRISLDPDIVDKVGVAGPGFVNFTFSHAYLSRQLVEINRLRSSYGSSNVGNGRRMQVEFVSANPTGPLVIVSARAAAVGAALVNVLKKASYEVRAEYYINDVGTQVEKLGRSLMARFRQRMGEEIIFPEDGYPGGYLVDLAGEIPLEEGQGWLELDEQKAVAVFGGFALDRIIALIKENLECFGVRYDNFFKESELYGEGGEVERAMEILKKSGAVYEKDGAQWFRSTDFGDEKDRVLVRADGSSTYFLADAAYHLNKLRRGFSHVVDIWGPDHHGYIKRLRAASVVLGAEEEWLEVLIVQWVRLIEDGKQVSMSKRGGEFVTLSDLVADVGADAAKFFFLMRKCSAHLDFNLTLARKESEENPVYYVQYAHARICSVISYAREQGVGFPEDTSCVELLREPEEVDLMRQLVIFPQLIEGIAATRDIQRLTSYAQQLAASFHHFYHICRIVSANRRLSGARLILAEAARIVLAETLGILGISAPERM